jgi:hypothetical protein
MTIFDPAKMRLMPCATCFQEDSCMNAGVCVRFGVSAIDPHRIQQTYDLAFPAQKSKTLDSEKYGLPPGQTWFYTPFSGSPPANKSKTLEPGSDSWWLYEYQKLMTNVLGWVETGKSETAIRVMQEMQTRWQNHK